jgi:hypothetical protein
MMGSQDGNPLPPLNTGDVYLRIEGGRGNRQVTKATADYFQTPDPTSWVPMLKLPLPMPLEALIAPTIKIKDYRQPWAVQ